MTAFHRSKEWLSFSRKVRPIIEAQLPLPCVQGCGWPVLPGQRWDVSHLVSHHLNPFQPLTIEYVGPGHRHCNRSDGGKEGRAKQLQKKRDGKRLPPSGSGW